MRNLKITIVLASLLGLLAFAGCGGDDDDSTSATTATEETTATGGSSASEGAEDYAQQLSSILQSFGDSFEQTASGLQGENEPDVVASGIDELESLTQATISDIEALDTPEAAEEGQDQVVNALQNLSDGLGSVESGDLRSPTALSDKLEGPLTTFFQEFSDGIAEITESGLSVSGGLGG